MCDFIPDMIQEFVDFIKSKKIGTECFFSKDSKEDNYFYNIIFSHFEIHEADDVTLYTIGWHDDDDKDLDFEHKVAFYVYKNNYLRTLGNVESALLSMLGRFNCEKYTKQIMKVLVLQDNE
jgi:hypothetical protein